MSLYAELSSHLRICPLGDKSFLPLDSLDETITAESVKAQLSREDLQFWSGLPGEVVQHAKKVFAILVLIDEPRAIKDLLLEGLTDEHLPLFPKGDRNDNILVSVRGKTFQSFVAWPSSARVDAFLEKQWEVQAPVFDATGSNIILNPKCALPFQSIAEVGRGQFGTVYKGVLHPAHQKGFKVSVPLSLASLTYTKVRRHKESNFKSLLRSLGTKRTLARRRRIWHGSKTSTINISLSISLLAKTSHTTMPYSHGLTVEIFGNFGHARI